MTGVVRKGRRGKLKFEQRFAGGEGVSLVDGCLERSMPGRGSSQRKGPGAGALVCSRNSGWRDGRGGGRVCCHFSWLVGDKDLPFILIASC